MKVTLNNGVEIECTPAEYEILCNKGLIPGVNPKPTITISTPKEPNKIEDPWEKIWREYNPQPGTNPYTPTDPFRDNTVMMYGCQIPNNSIRYLDTAPTAETKCEELTPEQFKRLNIIVGNNTDEQKS